MDIVNRAVFTVLMLVSAAPTFVQSCSQAPQRTEKKMVYDIEDDGAISDSRAKAPALLQLRSNFITFTGQPIGQSVTIPPRSTGEIIRLSMGSEEIAQVFTLQVGQDGTPGQDAGFSTPDFDVIHPGIEDAAIVAGVVNPNSIFIEWGGGGARHRTVIDANPKQTLHLAGSFLRVEGTNHGSGPVRMSALVSLLPRASAIPPVRTVFQGVVVPTDKAIFNGFPGFARKVKVVRYPQSVPISLLFTDGNINFVGEVKVLANQDCPEVLIPATAHEVQVRNDDAIVSVGINLMYMLEL